jgi:hypothetical protein
VGGVRAPGECARQLFGRVGGAAQAEQPDAAAEPAFVGHAEHAQLDGATQPPDAAGDGLVGYLKDLREPVERYPAVELQCLQQLQIEWIRGPGPH